MALLPDGSSEHDATAEAVRTAAAELHSRARHPSRQDDTRLRFSRQQAHDGKIDWDAAEPPPSPGEHP